MEFVAIYTHMAVQMIEKAHHRAINDKEELIHVARAMIKVKDNRNELNQQVKRLQNALDGYKARKPSLSLWIQSKTSGK